MSRKYDFDQRVDRRGTDCVKWDGLARVYADYLGQRKPEDVIALWIADMEFYPPEEISQAVEDRAAHHIYGYTLPPKDLASTVKAWINRHYELEMEENEFVYSPGIVPAIGVAMRALLEGGDGVIILSPVYGPFSRTIEQNGMLNQSVPLLHDETGWKIDFDGLEKAVNEKTKMLLFCSPHNPIGRVWTAEELEKIRDFVIKHDLILFSDEIHADFIYGGRDFISPANLEGMRERTISSFSPSKTFSVAGLMASAIVIQNPEMREKFTAELKRSGLSGNIFGYQAMRAAWLHGEAWLRELLVYLEGNIDFLMESLASLEKYGVRADRPESTYLLFIDFREFMAKAGLEEQAELNRFICEEAGLGLNPGTDFGPEGKGFMRLNFGCPRSTLEAAMERLSEALEKRLG
ncbi:MAG: PatB family C-S lyase [Eubacteriales bacterium]|nr:PatB family C-S lyase [Eubacteriales bacterium]